MALNMWAGIPLQHSLSLGVLGEHGTSFDGLFSAVFLNKVLSETQTFSVLVCKHLSSFPLVGRFTKESYPTTKQRPLLVFGLERLVTGVSRLSCLLHHTCLTLPRWHLLFS